MKQNLDYRNYESDRPTFWWLSLIIGILSLIVAFLSLKEPLVTLQLLTFFFIVFFFVGGISQITFALMNWQSSGRSTWILVDGVLNLAFAIIMIVLPAERYEIFIYFIAFYLLFQSITAIMFSISLSKIPNSGWVIYLIAAIIAFFIAIVLILQPEVTSLFIDMLFALTLIWYGVYKIFYAFQIKNGRNY